MITGSVSNQLDEMLAEGKHPHGSYETNEIAAVRNRCRVGQISLYGGALAEFGVSMSDKISMSSGVISEKHRYKPLFLPCYPA